MTTTPTNHKTKNKIEDRLSRIKSRFVKPRRGRPKKRGRPRKYRRAGVVSLQERYEKFSDNLWAGRINDQQLACQYKREIEYFTKRYKLIEAEILHQDGDDPLAPQASAMRRLWLAVIAEQLRSYTPTAKDDEVLKVSKWLAGSDFALVCLLADILPEKVLVTFNNVRNGRIDISGKWQLAKLLGG